MRAAGVISPSAAQYRVYQFIYCSSHKSIRMGDILHGTGARPAGGSAGKMMIEREEEEIRRLQSGHGTHKPGSPADGSPKDST